MLREQDFAVIGMMECGGSDILARMVRVTSLMLTAALIVASTPAAAADPMGALLDQIQRAQDRKQFKRAADLAAPASRSTDLRAADRFLLASLAAESYGEAFQHGGAPRQPRHDPAFLCAQRAVLQEALALTDEPRKVDDALGKVAAQLAQVAATERDVPCALAPVDGREAEQGPRAETPPAEPPPSAASSTAFVGPGQPPGVATVEASPVPTRSPADRRRVRAGVGTLVPGLLLFVPMGAVLAQRGQVERSLRQLQADTAGRALTDGELERAATLDRRFRGTTAAAAVLGAIGAALALTGLVLLATPKRRSQVAVAPWGARGVGGVILEGKF